jgi:hypothetical protein
MILLADAGKARDVLGWEPLVRTKANADRQLLGLTPLTADGFSLTPDRSQPTQVTSFDVAVQRVSPTHDVINMHRSVLY